MGRMLRRPGGEGPREPRFDSAPMLDQVDWAHKILYGDLHLRLAAIFEAKGGKRVEALPALLMAAINDGEAAIEAREAALSIIADNPGNKAILSLAPELSKKATDPRALFVLSAIIEANPDSPECRMAAPALMRALPELTKGEDEPLRDAVFALGRIGDASAADAIKKLLSSGRAPEGSDLWNTAMAALRRLDPQ